MPAWQYRIVYLKKGPADVEAEATLNAWGQQGWELFHLQDNVTLPPEPGTLRNVVQAMKVVLKRQAPRGHRGGKKDPEAAEVIPMPPRAS